jgi:hypothetical protein
MRVDYGFSTSEIAGVAAEAACSDLRELSYLLKQAPMSWRWLEEGADVSNMLTVRHGLAELAGATYAMQDAPAFLAATETLQRYSLAASHSYTATSAQLLLDVALGIALRQSKAAHQAAAAILGAGSHHDPALPMPLEAAAPNAGAPGAGRRLDGRAERAEPGQRMRDQAVQQAHHGLLQRMGRCCRGIGTGRQRAVAQGVVARGPGPSRPT